MFVGKYLSGPMSPSDVVREPRGFHIIYTVDSGDVTAAMKMVRSVAANTGAEVLTQKLIAVTTDADAELLLAVTVIKQGNPRQPGGRKRTKPRYVRGSKRISEGGEE